jgi:hypothetical protein
VPVVQIIGDTILVAVVVALRLVLVLLVLVLVLEGELLLLVGVEDIRIGLSHKGTAAAVDFAVRVRGLTLAVVLAAAPTAGASAGGAGECTHIGASGCAAHTTCASVRNIHPS